jgi:import inner membrane translocase subunit TIM50
MYARAAARINGQKAYYTEPTFQKLLPDKDKIPGGAPELTLVLSLEDLLLHSEWSTKHGYRLAKRPGLDYFLRYLSSQYELVIFTSVKSMDADPIIRKLDPFRLVMWPLFREATRFEKGEYIKVCRLPPTRTATANKRRIFPISTETPPKSLSWTPTHRT